MDFELRMAREKLDKEQRERKERARLKLQREKKAKDEALKQREAIEAAQRIRRLDAIEAQLQADEKMQEYTSAGRGIVFSRILEAVTFSGIGDKIKLPPSSFSELSDHGAFDKGPLHFHLSVVHQEGPTEMKSIEPKQTHCGVLEFTAEEGSVGLPPHVWDNLSLLDAPTSPLVEVRYVWLPKGAYAKLQPDNLGFSDIPYHKFILETRLRQHTTLSEGDVVTVKHGILTYQLRVLELKPASSVSILETDIEVDIVGPDLTTEMPKQHFLKPLRFGVAESGVVDEGNYNYYKFSIDDATWAKIASGSVRIEIKIVAESGNGDTDIYIAKHPLLFPTMHQHDWSSHDVGSKVLILSSKDTNLEAGSYSIGIYGYKGTISYLVSVNVEDNGNLVAGQQTGSSSAIGIDTVECKNCRHRIPSRSIALHEAYCSRHNVACKHPGCGVVLRAGEAEDHLHCDKCGQAFQQGEMEKHLKVYHEPLQCPCGIVLEKEQMDEHQNSACPLRLITCRFCGDMVEAEGSSVDLRDRLKGLSEHESKCGSRTARCDSCGRSVMLKEMDIHQVVVHQKS